jgi:hypothetical protein
MSDDPRQQRLDARNRIKRRVAASQEDRVESRAEALASARTLVREIGAGPEVGVCRATCVDDIWGSQGMSSCDMVRQWR